MNGSASELVQGLQGERSMASTAICDVSTSGKAFIGLLSLVPLVAAIMSVQS